MSILTTMRTRKKILVLATSLLLQYQDGYTRNAAVAIQLQKFSASSIHCNAKFGAVNIPTPSQTLRFSPNSIPSPKSPSLRKVIPRDPLLLQPIDAHSLWESHLSTLLFGMVKNLQCMIHLLRSDAARTLAVNMRSLVGTPINTQLDPEVLVQWRAWDACRIWFTVQCTPIPRNTPTTNLETAMLPIHHLPSKLHYLHQLPSAILVIH